MKIELDQDQILEAVRESFFNDIDFLATIVDNSTGSHDLTEEVIICIYERLPNVHRITLKEKLSELD
jgi:hypothetical protein